MVRLKTGDEQSRSTFFTRLNPDVRREILLQLFGSRHVHVKFASSGASQVGFRRHGHPPLTFVGWLHCVCKSGGGLAPHAHSEVGHKWRYLSVQILRTCKRAFEEGITLLYSTNTLLFENSVDLVNFGTLAVAGVGYIRSLDLNMTLGGPSARESARQDMDALRLVSSTLSNRSVWWALRQVRIRVVDQLDDTPPKRQRKKMRKEAERVFTRALRTLLEDGRLRIQVIVSAEGGVLEPSAPLQMDGLTFVREDRFRRDWWVRGGQEIDSDHESAFNFLVQVAHLSQFQHIG